MNRDDWRAGMEHEAASVDDERWAEQTRLAADRLHFARTWGRAALAFAGLAAAQVLFVQVAWGTQTPPAPFWPALMWTFAAVGLALGFLRLSPLTVVAAAPVYLPAAWLATLALQGTLGAGALRSPGFDDEGITVLMVLAANGAYLGQFLRHGQAPRSAVK